jgi:hypothetical protein
MFDSRMYTLLYYYHDLKGYDQIITNTKNPLLNLIHVNFK